MLNLSHVQTTIGGAVNFLAGQKFQAVPVTIDETYVDAESNGNKQVEAGTYLGRVTPGGTLFRPYVAAVQASLTTAGGNAHSHIKFTAVPKGVAGNAVKVAMLDPGGNSKPLEVTVVNDQIRVSLATSGAGAITSTAAEVVAAVNSALAALGLVTAAVKTAETGAGVVAALVATALADGADASCVPECILLEDVLLSEWSPSAGLVHFDKASFALESGRVIEARLPVAPDAVVKAALKGVHFV